MKKPSKRAGSPLPVASRPGMPGESLQIVYGANADIRKVLVLFNVSVQELQLDPDAAEHVAAQLTHYATIARGRVQ